MKNITLTISAARSGTRMLSKLFATIKNMTADHECEAPSFCSMRQENILNPDSGLEFVKNYFLPYIESCNGLYYSNTAQSCSKGFIEHFLTLGIKPNFVLIRRNPRDIAKSLWRLDWIPGKHPMHRVWYPGPQEPNVLPVHDWKSLNSYQLCYWYVADCEKRAQYYEKILPQLGLKVWHTTTEDIPILEKFNNMLDYFSLPNVDTLPQKKFNTLESWKKDINKSIPPDDILSKFEVELLDRIPQDWKDNLIERGWLTNNV